MVVSNRLAEEDVLNPKDTKSQRKTRHSIDIIEKMAQSSPKWLSLFHAVTEERQYSFLTLAHAVSPLFFFCKRQPRNEAGQLPILKRRFEFPKSKAYPEGLSGTLRIVPARIEVGDKDGGESFRIEYYPGDKEFILLEVLKKMAMHGQGIVLDDYLGVSFLVADVISELKKIGQSSNHSRIVFALIILADAKMIFSTEEGSSWRENYILSLGISDADKYNKNRRIFVRFNTEMTNEIRNAEHRIFSTKILRSGNPLAIRLHQYIMYTYTQLEFGKPYHLYMKKFLEMNAGFAVEARSRNSAALLEKALEVLKEQGDIYDYTRSPILIPGSQRVEDYLYKLFPGKAFEMEMIKANARRKARRQALESGSV